GWGAGGVLDVGGFGARAEALDGEGEGAPQIALLLGGRKRVGRAAGWLLHTRRPPFDIRATIEFFSAGMDAIGAGLPKLLAGRDLAGFSERRGGVSRRRGAGALAGPGAPLGPGRPPVPRGGGAGAPPRGAPGR